MDDNNREVPDLVFDRAQNAFTLRSNTGNIQTSFVFPPQMKNGDELPKLNMLLWNDSTNFTFSGYYNEETDNMEFFVEGPIGYVYKGSLQVDICDDLGESQGYSWKMKRHAHTREGRSLDCTQFFVPRVVCLAGETTLATDVSGFKWWSFFGHSVPATFARLTLKLAFSPATCCENPPEVQEEARRDHEEDARLKEQLHIQVQHMGSLNSRGSRRCCECFGKRLVVMNEVDNKQCQMLASSHGLCEEDGLEPLMSYAPSSTIASLRTPSGRIREPMALFGKYQEPEKSHEKPNRYKESVPTPRIKRFLAERPRANDTVTSEDMKGDPVQRSNETKKAVHLEEDITSGSGDGQSPQCNKGDETSRVVRKNYNQRVIFKNVKV